MEIKAIYYAYTVSLRDLIEAFKLLKLLVVTQYIITLGRQDNDSASVFYSVCQIPVNATIFFS